MVTRYEDIRANEMYQPGDPDMDVNSDGVQISRRGNRAVVDFNPGMSRMGQDETDDHSANLADELDETALKDLANQVIEWVEVDLESRKDWQRRMDQAMELLGLNNIPLEELPFDGASAVTYPLISEAVVQFQSRAIEEVFPSDGPVKTKIVGRTSVEKEEQADRIKNHMNYQMTVQDRSYFWEVDSMLFYLPIGGSAFKKTYFDDINEMVVSPFIKPNDFIVPYIATSLQTAPRYTHRMYKNQTEMKKHFASGFYREFELLPTTPMAVDNAGDEMGRDHQDQADDRSAEMHADDNIYTLYECHCDLELDIDDAPHPLPYIVTVDKDTREVCGIRRNWKAEDPLMQKRVWFTHYKYLPGLGFYGFGLLHLIGSLAEASSGAIRALLDSAAFANMQGGYVSNDAKFEAGDEHIDPGVYKEVNMSAEELQRAFYTPPFKDPSPALAQLLESLVEAGKSFSSSTEVMTGDASNTGPVGTTVALIEQGSKPFSAIHRRLHMSAAEEFALRAELNYEFLPDQYPYEVEGNDPETMASGEGVVLRQDYDGRVDVIPVSDPNVFSSVQRIAQSQALVQLASENPDLYNRMAVHERFLRAIRIPDYEELLQKNDPKRLDPVRENMLFMQGQSGIAFIEQDHDAHMAVHMNFVNSLSEDALEIVGPLMQAHIAEHVAFKYFNEVNRQLGGQLPAPGTFEGEQEMPPEMDQMIAQAASQLPQIEIMPEGMGSPDLDEMAFQNEERRKDEAHQRELDRKDEAMMAESNRKDIEALEKSQREDAVETLRQQREKRAAEAKERREDAANAAKIKREERLARAKASQQSAATKSSR